MAKNSRKANAAKTVKSNGAVKEPAPMPVVEEQKQEVAETNQEQTASPVAEGTKMDIVLSFSKANKSGKRGLFTSPMLRRGIALPASLFPNKQFPTSVTLSGDAFETMSGDEQSRIDARNAKRAAKGLKPLPTAAERAEQLKARIEKRQKQLDNARAAAAKLSAKMGAAPVADSTEGTDAN